MYSTSGSSCDARRRFRRQLDANTPIAIVRDGAAALVAFDCEEIVRSSAGAAFAAVDRMQRSGEFWAGALSYDLGRAVERVGDHARDDRGFDDLVFGRFSSVERIDPTDIPIWLGRADTIADCASDHVDLDLGPMTSSIDRSEWAVAIDRIREHLAAGDCYQVNLTRRLTTQRQIDSTALMARLSYANPAPHQALLRFDDLALVSASPEQFVRVDGRTIETRPIKGTGVCANQLVASRKDQAEHVMIVDLARNDLGRVCEFSTVCVPELQHPEPHPGLVHLVSTVRGTARREVGLGAILRAMYPAASITGAPKPRVTAIIDELEPVRRGYYCGSVGFIDAARETADLSVAIRTFTISPFGTDLGIGGGIVWDSDADAEWDETTLKAARLLQTASGRERTRTLLHAH